MTPSDDAVRTLPDLPGPAETLKDSFGASYSVFNCEQMRDYARAAIAAHQSNAAAQEPCRALLIEWLGGMYESQDFLRRVRLAVHGPLRKPVDAAPVAAAPDEQTQRAAFEKWAEARIDERCKESKDWDFSYDEWDSSWRSWKEATRLAAQAQRTPEPLTDEQIVEIRDEHLPNQGERFDCVAFARAILAASPAPPEAP